MRTEPDIRRVILVVLDGLRPDAIDRFDLVHLNRLMANGASTKHATTVAPSITTAAITSLLTGVSPMRHGVTSDRVFIPTSATSLKPIPELLANHGLPSSSFMADVPTLFRGVANRVGRRLGFGSTRFAGKTAPEVLLAARSTLRLQTRGLIFLHWPDADRAGHSRGWMSPAYEEAAHCLDGTLGMLHALAQVAHDPSTLLIACADHGGGGFTSNDHNSDHPLDRTIPILMTGGGVVRQQLGAVRLLDIPPTVLWALGVNPPTDLEGRVLSEAFETYVDAESAASAVA
jgi:predicted AlkP superfamily pyrophosphatase or phosphodiesterase